MFLNAIFAFCFLAQSISTTAAQPVKKLEREAQELVKILNGTCKMFKVVPCGNQRIREIELAPAMGWNNTILCTSYSNTFCQINHALKELNHSECRNANVTQIQGALKTLKGHVKCQPSDHPIIHITLKAFCSRLLNYVQTLYNLCSGWWRQTNISLRGYNQVDMNEAIFQDLQKTPERS